MGRGWKSLEDSGKDRKRMESLELPRDVLNDLDQNADIDMNRDGQADEVSDGDEELIGNFELECAGLWCSVEEISKQQGLQDVAWLFLTVYTHMCEQRDDLKLSETGT